ncbi:MAG: hypothetical protein ABI592_10440 [Acidobacteriota bacterium]
MPASLCRLRFVFMLAILAFATSRAASACSICRCGDPTFNALGSNVYSSGQLHLALDWDRFDKSQATEEGGEAGRDEEVENRYTATLSYSYAERVVGVVRLPYSTRTLTTSFDDGSDEVRTSGFSDPEIYTLVRLWSSDFGPGLGRRAWLSAVLGVKTPRGSNRVRRNGERADEHAQPGTGSTDLFGGLSSIYLVDDHSSIFASAQYRGTGRNAFGYRYGDIATVNLAYERKLTEKLDGVIEANYRSAAPDEVDGAGERDPNTGGKILYLTPRAMFEVSSRVVLRVAAQIPVWKRLHGIQREKANLNAGVTLLF